MKSTYKYELAAAAGVSDRTFRRWMNMHQNELKILGVTKHSHLIPPKAVKWICQEYGIDYPMAV